MRSKAAGTASPRAGSSSFTTHFNVIQRQLGHANLGITSVYLEGIDAGEIIETVHGRRAPLVPAVTALGH
jgi:hypothetical protein